MCLSKPKRVIRVDGNQALVEFRGDKTIVNIANQQREKQKIRPGDYVLCQSGFVVQKISKEKADEIMKEWTDFS